MDIKVELDKITKNIHIPMVFYIPHALFPDLSEDIRKKLLEVQFFNTLGIINIKGESKSLINDTSSLDILKKSNILKSNFIQLIDLESNLTKETFYHLLSEYLTSAQAYDYAYSWMVDHIVEDIPNVEDNYKNFFIYQAEVSNLHIQEINDRYSLSNNSNHSPIDFKKIFDKGKELLNLDDGLASALMHPIKTQTKNFKKKTVLPSEDEVDNMLLTQVFNIKLSKA